MKDNYLIGIGFILDSWLYIYLIIMKHEARQLKEVQKKKRKSKNGNKMTDQEFVEFLDRINPMDPEEEERLLEESWEEGYREWLRGQDEDEEYLESEDEEE